MDYSTKIKELREKLLISQLELAKLINVSFASVSRWENKRHEPTLRAKRALKRLFLENEIEVGKDGHN